MSPTNYDNLLLEIDSLINDHTPAPQSPIAIIDAYITSSDLADIGDNLWSFREILVLRERIHKRKAL
jgi:hypothetical protein